MFREKAFTLVELLVVISIVGLLSSIVFSSVSNARAKARDAQRISALKQIQAAIELYAADHNGQYPGYLQTENSYVRSVLTTAEVGSPPSRCGYGAPGTPGDGSPGHMPGIWCKFETALAPYIKSLPETTGAMPPFYAYIYKVPSQSPTYNPNGMKGYGLAVALEQSNNISKNDGGFYDNWFEIGELPSYCKAKNSNWNSWSGVPCSCTVYYSSGCVY